MLRTETEASALKKGDVIELDITDINNLGNGVGRYFGQVVFVRGAVSGDRVCAEVIKLNSAFAVARLLKVLTASEHRCEQDPCNAPLSCGGCVYRHITYEHELSLKRGYVKNAFAKAGIDDANVLPVLHEEPLHYRNKGMYPISKTKNGMFAGFYAAKTHTVVPGEGCAIQNESFGNILRAVCDFGDRYGIQPYDENTGKGLLRHIYLRIGEYTGEIMLCLVINGDVLPHSDALVDLIVKNFPSVVSIILNKNKQNTNVVLGKEYLTLYGKGGIEDVLCGLRFFISPDSFYQVNRKGAELLYRKASELAELRGDELLLDLYCGTGTIGLSMADKVKTVHGIEINGSAVACARENAKRNGIENAFFTEADAGVAQNILKATNGRCPDVVLIDPPRKGSTKELVQCLSSIGVPRVVYISCDPDTLARDAVYFRELGYKMSDIQPVDMFPSTGHVECVCVMTK